MQGKTRKHTLFAQVGLLLVLFIFLNLIASKLYFRLDFTEDKRYTLSSSTLNLLKNLEQVITVKAYFSEDLPPDVLPLRREFEEVLTEYAQRSKNGRLVYAFENPNESEEKERSAQQEGITPALLNVRERDQVKQMRAYMGAVLYAGDKKEVVPFLNTQRSPEYALTIALTKLLVKEPTELALLQGYEEATVEQLKEVQKQLDVRYKITPFSLPDSTSIPTTYRTLLWIAPKKDILPADMDKVSDYLKRGGSVFVAHSIIEADLKQLSLSEKNIGIKTFLKRYGVDVVSSAVVDANANSVNVAQQQAGFTITTQIRFPYFPIIQTFAEHPITTDLEAAYLQFPCAFTYTDTASNFVSLMRTSEYTGLTSLPGYIDIQKDWSKTDFRQGPVTVALALEGTPLPSSEAKLVAVAEQNFVVPYENNPNLSPDNILFAANAIDWLSDDTGLVELRSKGISSRPLEAIEDETKTLLSYLNMGSPIFIILLYAVLRAQYVLWRRNQWIKEI